jgi:hypothetical protein
MGALGGHVLGVDAEGDGVGRGQLVGGRRHHGTTRAPWAPAPRVTAPAIGPLSKVGSRSPVASALGADDEPGQGLGGAGGAERNHLEPIEQRLQGGCRPEAEQRAAPAEAEQGAQPHPAIQYYSTVTASTAVLT